MTNSKARLCVVVLFVALVAGACGSADELSGPKQEYVAQVDAICAELQDNVGELGANPEQQARAVEDAVNRIKGVSKPREDSIIADRYIASMENLFLSLMDADQALRVNDQPRAQQALETAAINNRNAAEAAEEYGMVVCAQEL